MNIDFGVEADIWERTKFALLMISQKVFNIASHWLILSWYFKTKPIRTSKMCYYHSQSDSNSSETKEWSRMSDFDKNMRRMSS